MNPFYLKGKEPKRCTIRRLNVLNIFLILKKSFEGTKLQKIIKKGVNWISC